MGSKQRHPLRVLKSSIKPKAKVVKSSLCSFGFIVGAVQVLGLVLFYYAFSIGLTFYNQRFIHRYRVPLSFTLSHLVIKFILAGLVRCLIECKTKKPRVVIPWRLYVTRLAPTGITSVLDIGLSNWSFEFITVSLYTMTKSSAVIFILGFSLLLRLEKPRCSLVFVVILISGGLFLFTYHSTQFNTEGFLMVLSASVLSGLRWTLAQVVTQKNEIGLHNPIDMMYHVQPWMIIGLLPFSAIFEGLKYTSTQDFFAYRDVNVVLENLALVLGGAVLAFCLEFSEFLLLVNTSSLTLSVSGIFKELCTLYLAHKVNNDQMNVINALGLVVCLLGICLHVVLKAVYKKVETSGDMVGREEAMEMLRSSDDSDIDSEEDVFNAVRDR